jgi:outer membrane immunogenic protein
MRFRSTFVAVMALVLISAPAVAADMPVKAQPYAAPALAATWTGPYVGAFVGYHWGDITQSGCVGLCPDGQQIRVGFGGVQLGYDWQMPNNWVIGLSARIPVASGEQTVSLAPGIDFREKPEFEAFFTARAGYAMGNWLPYLAFGGGFARNRIYSGVTGIEDSATHTGIGGGAGIEYRLAHNWSVDLRYMYAVFSKETYDLGGGPEQFGDESSNVMFAVNYRF